MKNKMNKQASFIIILCLIIISAVLLNHFNKNNGQLKSGMSKNKVLKILGINKKNPELARMTFNLKASGKPQKLEIITLYYDHIKNKFDSSNPVTSDSKLKYNLESALLLCFREEKLEMWGYGRKACMDIDKRYRVFSVLSAPWETGKSFYEKENLYYKHEK